MAAVRDALAARLAHLASLSFTAWTLVALGAALVVAVALPRLRSAPARERLLVVASLVVLACLVSPVLALAWWVYALVFHAATERLPRTAGTLVLAVLLIGMVVVPVRAIGALGDAGGHVRELTAFATNMALLRFYAYAWDRRQGRIPADPLRRFLLAMLFFPTFTNGPVETPRQLTEGWTTPALAPGLGRIALGVAKLTVVALLFPAGWMAPLSHVDVAGAATLWSWGVRLYVWFYLSFSAWTDVAIGLARLCGRHALENFHAPWLATDPADFWRRWHVSFGIWLRDYVYIPLGGNRRHRVLNVLLTFVVSALWHVWGSVKILGLGLFGPAAWGGFLVWGLLHGVGVVITPALHRVLPAGGAVTRTAARVATFLFAAACWIAFFLPPGIGVGAYFRMLRRMVLP